jgi:hypothetical protein
MGWHLVTDVLAQRPRLSFRPFHVGFVVDRVTQVGGLSVEYVIFSHQYHLTNVPQSFIHLSWHNVTLTVESIVK